MSTMRKPTPSSGPDIICPMANEHTFYLTKKQEQKLANLLDLVYARSANSKAIPPQMFLLIGGVRRAILDKDPLEQMHIDVCIWAMDLVFAQFSEEDMDIQLEMCYHKLTGYWYEGFDPWYVRLKNYDREGVYKVRKDKGGD